MLFHVRSLLSFCTALILALATLTSNAQAEDLLFLSPTRINLNDQEKVATMNVSNLSDQSRTYTLNLVDVIMTEDGVTEEVDTFEYSAKRLLRFVPRQFTIPPGSRQTIRIMHRLPTDLPPGAYHSHINFVEDITKRGKEDKDAPAKSKAAISAPIEYSALIPIIIHHGKTEAVVTMKDVTIKQQKREEAGAYVATMTLMRDGNDQGLAVTEIRYVAPSGEETTLGNRSTAHIYREISSRKAQHEFKIPADIPPGGKIKVLLYTDSEADSKPSAEVVLDLPH